MRGRLTKLSPADFLIIKDAPLLSKRAWRVWRRDGSGQLVARARKYVRHRSLARAFDEYGPWISGFMIDGVHYGGSYDPMNDWRIARLLDEVSIKGKRVLELGSFEGGHTAALAAAGAEVVAVEGRKANFRRCLLVSEIFGLTNVSFQMGDIRNVTRETHGTFDIALAIGVLYHLPDPERLLANLLHMAPQTLLWTHVADEKHPVESRHGELQTAFGKFRGKMVGEDSTRATSALDRDDAIWLYREDLLALIKAIGYRDCRVLAEQPADALPSPAVLALLSA